MEGRSTPLRRSCAKLEREQKAQAQDQINAETLSLFILLEDFGITDTPCPSFPKILPQPAESDLD